MAKPTRIYTDIDLNFNSNPVTGDIFVLSDTNSIASALKNLLLTAHYEKPFAPQYGCGIRYYLFEQISMITGNIIQKEIEQTISNYEPRINLQQVLVQPNPDESRYDITIVFFMVNNASPVTLNFFLERIR